MSCCGLTSHWFERTKTSYAICKTGSSIDRALGSSRCGAGTDALTTQRAILSNGDASRPMERANELQPACSLPFEIRRAYERPTPSDRPFRRTWLLRVSWNRADGLGARQRGQSAQAAPSGWMLDAAAAPLACCPAAAGSRRLASYGMWRAGLCLARIDPASMTDGLASNPHHDPIKHGRAVWLGSSATSQQRACGTRSAEAPMPRRSSPTSSRGLRGGTAAASLRQEQAREGAAAASMMPGAGAGGGQSIQWEEAAGAVVPPLPTPPAPAKGRVCIPCRYVCKAGTELWMDWIQSVPDADCCSTPNPA